MPVYVCRALVPYLRDNNALVWLMYSTCRWQDWYFESGWSQIRCQCWQEEFGRQPGMPSTVAPFERQYAKYSLHPHHLLLPLLERNVPPLCYTEQTVESSRHTKKGKKNVRIIADLTRYRELEIRICQLSCRAVVSNLLVVTNTFKFSDKAFLFWILNNTQNIIFSNK